MPGQWHNYIESKFPETMREVKFMCQNKSIQTIRRADILLTNNRTCEIQNSRITSNEIKERLNDWKSFGKDIIWIINGNSDDVIVEELTTGTTLIKFNNRWKYESFLDNYDYILLEASNRVYKISIRDVKCKMIEVKYYIDIDKVVDILKSNPTNIWNCWKDDNTTKASLTIHQQGAGNGKTYGIWKSICNNLDKTQFIITTKLNTAKTTIYEELMDQLRRNEYHIEMSFGEEENIENQHTTKQYVIKYIHKTSGKECCVIISTIDSLIYNLAKPHESCDKDMFMNIMKNIIKYGFNKLTKFGFMEGNFAGQNVFINKNTEIWIDEAQDLQEIYLDVMTRLMLETGVDVHIVGDKLQSLMHEDNIFTTLCEEGLTNINVIKDEPSNHNRRIKVNGMHNIINSVIPFSKYDLPEITCNDSLEDSPNSIEIIQEPHISKYSKEEDMEIENYTNNIMSKFEYEVDTHYYLPADFSILFPIMVSNILR